MSSSTRPKPIDQSSIIKNNDESAFHNNLNIFPSGNNNTNNNTNSNTKVPSAHMNASVPPNYANRGGFPNVTNFQKDSLDAAEQRRGGADLGDEATQVNEQND